jgi:hypothetical protein
MTDAMLAKVRKLLAKAEDPACPPAEAEALTAKAAELIAKYGVDRARLAVSEPASDPIGDRRVTVLPPYARDKAELLSDLAYELRCRAVRRRAAGDDGYEMHLFGFASDLERAELLYTSLLVQAAHGLAATPVPDWEHPAAYRRSWLRGFRCAVADRLRAAEHRAGQAGDAAGGPSTAVVLAGRVDRVQQRLAQTYPTARTARRRQLTGGGVRAGLAAGRRADLGGSAVPASRPAGALPRLG